MMLSTRHFRQPGKANGFALVAVLTLMVLLLLLGLGMLSLSSVSLRTSGTNQDMEQARANARLALMIAIGRLQEEMGPDTRISSSAAILDSTPEDEQLDGVTQPHFLGVWDSWDTWLTDPKTFPDGSSIGIADTYNSSTRGRNPKLFRRWLVSGTEAETHDINFAKTYSPTSPSTQPFAILVGKPDAGTSTDGIVQAPIVPIGDPSKASGGYAWWVGDQSEKVRADLEERGPASGLQLTQGSSSSLGRPAIEEIEPFGAIDTSPDKVEKWVDLSTLYAATGQAPDPSTDLPFHTITTESLGLMTDVRFGGMKRDLNTGFENATIPAEFGRTTVFGRNFDRPVRPMKGEIANISPANPYVAPLSWRQMHQYYRLYRDFTGNTHGRYLQWPASAPLSRQFMMGEYSISGNKRRYMNPDTDGYARKIIPLRQYWIISLRTQVVGATNEYYLTAVPIMYYWNPYNVPVTLDSKELESTSSLKAITNLRCTVYDGNVSKGSFNWVQQANASDGGAYQNYWTRMAPTTVSFQPGEVRVFSTNSIAVEAGQYFLADFGYIPVTDNSAARGLQLKIPYTMTPGNTASMALAFSTSGTSTNSLMPYFNGNDLTSVSMEFAQADAQPYGGMDQNGDPIGGGANKTTGVTSIAWLAGSERQTAIIPDTPADRQPWPTGNGIKAVALLGFTAKDPDGLFYDGANTGYAADYRGKTWLHSAPTSNLNYLINPQQLNRAASPWQVYFTPATGNSISNYIQTDGNNAFFGGSFGASGASRVVALELPTSPITNLAGFAGMRMDAARAHDLQQVTGQPAAPEGTGSPSYKHASHTGGDFGPAIGNAYASPMIPGEKLYHNIPFGADLGCVQRNNKEATNFDAFSDFWDQLFLTNEALWDSYFMSSIVPESTGGSINKSLEDVAEGFFNGDSPLSNSNYTPITQGKTAAELAGLATQSDGWKSIGSYIGIKGAFNVNSTSVEAWKAMLLTMRDREIPYLDATDGTTGVVSSPDDVVVSRFRLANGDADGDDPSDQAAWTGVRYLNDARIDRLATEIVKQVKLRGPFLNMSDFINRRLSDDRLGVTGALQAAIDWDEFDAGYNGSGSSDAESINRGFKQGGAMITSPAAAFPNDKAAKGSRFAGAPGYVMQSDLLQGIGSSLTVRGDTFKVRAYGEARDSSGTKVTARAWCEATVQRMPGFVDPTNPPETAYKNEDGSGNAALSEINREFGRQMRVVSFRWLSPSEINP